MELSLLVSVAALGSTLALTPKDPPYGALSVKGSKIVDSKGTAVQLTGMSLYWSQVNLGGTYAHVLRRVIFSGWDSSGRRTS